MAAVRPVRADELHHRDDRLQQLDRIVTVLTEQNHTLRGKLVAIQVDVQRRKEALLQAASGEATKIADAASEALRPAFAVRSN